MDDWRVAQPSCPPRDGFAVANLFSAKGALSSLAWGNRPRLAITSRPWRNRICTEAGETPACPTARMAVLR